MEHIEVGFCPKSFYERDRCLSLPICIILHHWFLGRYCMYDTGVPNFQSTRSQLSEDGGIKPPYFAYIISRPRFNGASGACTRYAGTSVCCIKPLCRVLRASVEVPDSNGRQKTCDLRCSFLYILLGRILPGTWYGHLRDLGHRGRRSCFSSKSGTSGTLHRESPVLHTRER
jgi:hypothetical protein